MCSLRSVDGTVITHCSSHLAQWDLTMVEMRRANFLHGKDAEVRAASKQEAQRKDQKRRFMDVVKEVVESVEDREQSAAEDRFRWSMCFSVDTSEENRREAFHLGSI